MPAWFMDIESATEALAKSNATPPASRIAAQASRANSPSSALQGVTRPSVDATPTKGLRKSMSFKPSARRNARCGARSSPSTVMREGSFFMVTDDFLDAGAGMEAQMQGPSGGRRLRHGVHDGLNRGIRRETHPARRPALHRVPHLLRGYRDTGEEQGALPAVIRNPQRMHERLHHALQGDARHA